MELEADAGDSAAGDLVGGEGLAVFVGEVEETVNPWRFVLASG